MKKSIERVQTGITGIDELFGGGVPQNRAMLLLGTAGSGKTALLNSFLYYGIVRQKENGVFVTFEERPADLIENVRGFGWDFERLVREKKLFFVDASPDTDSIHQENGRYDLSPFLERVKSAVRRSGARRVAIDSLGVLFSRFDDAGSVRTAMFKLFQVLKELRVTALVSSEVVPGSGSRHGVEEFVADSVVELNVKPGQQQAIREIVVRKMRGADYRSGKVEFTITSEGLTVYPKIPVDRGVSRVNFKKRHAFGVSGLDGIMGGGIPQGQVCMISGNTGTGKTTLASHFLDAGLKKGESVVFVALEEHLDESRARARLHGFRFERFEKTGKLRLVSPESLIDICNDKLLYEIVDAVKRGGAKRLVIDSISSLMSATQSEEEVRQFLIQLSGFCKSQGVTCVLNYLISGSFGAEKGQLLGSLDTNLMRLSSVVDAVVLLRFVERGQSVQKLLNVLKIRGSSHSKNIFQYEIDRRGFQMGRRFQD